MEYCKYLLFVSFVETAKAPSGWREPVLFAKEGRKNDCPVDGIITSPGTGGY